MEIRTLGTAQDAGTPQAGCDCRNCALVRTGALRARLPASVAAVTNSEVVLFDAGPAVGAQLDPLLASGLRLAALFLTHAHWGHVAGLGYLGPPGLNLRGLPTHAPADTVAAHERAEPFLDWRPLAAGDAVTVGALIVKPLAVPHRADAGTTFAYVVSDSARRLLYCPDTDRWTEEAVAAAHAADLALVDGTFWSADELAGRDRSTVPHPPVREALERFRGARALFTHLNHTNPLLRPESEERRALSTAGLGVTEEGPIAI